VKSVVADVYFCRGLNHEFIVKFYGICVVDSKQYIVTEYCGGGSALSYLNGLQKKDIKPSQILRM
jgi:serine/threonine protein kinase